MKLNNNINKINCDNCGNLIDVDKAIISDSLVFCDVTCEDEHFRLIERGEISRIVY